MIPTHFQEVETLYRRILQSGAKSFAVTTPASGQGASTLAYTVARRCAKAGSRVLMVELQSGRSSLSEAMAIPRIGWFPTRESADAATTALDQGKLTLLAAPTHKLLPLGFREPETLKHLADQWRERFDFVFIETAALNANNRHEISPVSAMRLTDKIILSVMPRKTTHQELSAAAEKIQQSGTEILGTVINDRHNPLLVDELKRQVRRLSWFPKLNQFLQTKLHTIPLLRQQP